MKRIFFVAAEASGDRLGASLMSALRKKDPEARFEGVGGDAMCALGLQSLFPMSELSAFGFADVFKNFFRLRRRINDLADAIIADPPSALVLIDSFGLSYRIAKRVRTQRPGIPIVKYVAPQVWVWREGRAKAMRPYFDHTLALFPFEPEVHRKLGGPPCTYIGHPVLEEISRMRPDEAEAHRRESKPPLVVVMPGSRRSELRALIATFGEALAALSAGEGPFELVLPTLPQLEGEVRESVASWANPPRIVLTEAEKFAALRSARVAIAASGTATLELALAAVPHIGAYRVRWWEAAIARRLVKVKMALLPNILLEERLVPELLQEDCTPEAIVTAVAPLLRGGIERQRQLDGFARLDAILATPEPPSERAAAVLLEILARAGEAASDTNK